MKMLLIILAVAMAGCSTTQAPPETASAEPVPVEIVTPLVVTLDEPVQANTGRIDAATFLQILVDSGCTVGKAEYKEVDRGGGISVTCAPKPIDAPSSDPLSAEGIADL